MNGLAYLSYPNSGIGGHMQIFASEVMLVLHAKIGLQAVDLALFRRFP